MNFVLFQINESNHSLKDFHGGQKNRRISAFVSNKHARNILVKPSLIEFEIVLVIHSNKSVFKCL